MEEKEKNPGLVLDAITSAPSQFGDVTIGDVTILKYAYLEKMKSPFVDASSDFSVENVAASVFALSQDKAELKKYGGDVEKLKADALDWADEHLRMEDVPEIIRAVVAKFQALNKAAPSSAGGDGKKK